MAIEGIKVLADLVDFVHRDASDFTCATTLTRNELKLLLEAIDANTPKPQTVAVLAPTPAQIATLLTSLDAMLDDDDMNVSSAAGDAISDALGAFPFHACDLCGKLMPDFGQCCKK
jgi:hypothetical protein